MQDSIFTKIIKGEIPSYKIYEDDKVFAFLDIHPVQPGHTLLIPKQQIDRVEDLDDELYQHIWQVAKKLMTHLRTSLGTERTTLKIEGFDIPHVHIHLIPCNTAKDFWNRVSMDDSVDHKALKAVHQKVTLL